MATDNLQNEPIRTNWQAAWEAYASAKAESDEYERTVFNPACEKIDQLRDGKLAVIEARKELEAEAVPDWDAINDKMEELNDKTYSDREWTVLLTPAPDRDALEWKMNLLFGGEEEDGYSSSWRMDGINALLADVRRLLNH